MYLAEAFNKAGIPAEHIDGTTYHMERHRIYQDVHSGKTKVLTNCAVLIEGWDEPQNRACILARPTKSVTTNLQMAGRVLRPFEGKTDAILIDHSGAVRELGFVHDERKWTLEATKAVDPREDPLSVRDEDEEREEENIVCEQCHTVYRGRRKCPNCGWEPPRRKPKPVKVLEAELEEVLANKARQEYKLDFYERALGYEKMYRLPKGWADEAWRLKFKEPLTPMAKRVGIPDDEMRRWHQHMIIREKYRKAPRRKVVNG
jgi:superfamily II DNA or RNA helicase